MKKKSRAKNSPPKTTLVAAGSANSVECLLASLRAVIQEARQQALRAVDIIQVRTCWLVGRHIVEFEQGGQAR